MAHRWEQIRAAIRRLVAVIGWGIWLALVIMWPLSERLSSIGFERERVVGEWVENRWHGIVYPGTGSIMIGCETTFERYHGQRVDALDLASAFLQKPVEDRAANAWERAGFIWRMTGRQHWVGIPAWLAALLASVCAGYRVVRRIRKARVVK